MTDRIPFRYARGTHVLHRIGNARHVREPHRCAVVVPDDDRLVVVSLRDLVIGDDVGCRRTIGHLSLGKVGVLSAEHRLNARKTQPVAVELRRVDIHSHRGQRSPAHHHLSHAVDLRKLLLHDCRSFVIQFARVIFLGSQSQNHDRSVRGIYFAIGGIAGQISRQISASCTDGSLNIACRAIDVTAEIELNGNSRAAQRTRGGHL